MSDKDLVVGHISQLTADVSKLREQLAHAQAEIERLKKGRKKRSPKDDYEHKIDLLRDLTAKLENSADADWRDHLAQFMKAKRT